MVVWHPSKVHCLLLNIPFWPTLEPVPLNMQLKQLPHDLDLKAQDVVVLWMLIMWARTSWSCQMRPLLPVGLHQEVSQITISLLEHFTLSFRA
jgi:hypothetical protein